MKRQNLFWALIIILVGAGCTGEDAKDLLPGLEMALSADSSSVQISHVPRFVAEQLKTDSLSEDDWHRLFAVYEEGNEFRPVPGKYSVDSAGITFVPDQGFRKGSTYLAECYIRNQPYDARRMAAGRPTLFGRQVYRESFDF